MDKFYYIAFPNNPKPMLIMGTIPMAGECIVVYGGLYKVDKVTTMHIIHGDSKKMWAAKAYTVIFVINIYDRFDL